MIYFAHAGRKLAPTPLAGIDLNSGYMPVRRMLFFAGQPDVPRLQTSLSTALEQWPDFAGTIALLDGTLSLDRNDTGVRITVETINEPIPPFGIDYPSALPNPFCDESIVQKAGDGAPVFSVKITCYNDNHWVLGTCNSHALCDGSGYWQFMQSWIDAFHGRRLPDITSNFMRHTSSAVCDHAVSTPPQLTLPAVPLLQQQMMNLGIYRTTQLQITQQQLENLKNRVNTALSPQWVSTMDVLIAVLWQCLARVSIAHGASSKEVFPLANVINIRPRLKLHNYTGNMAFSVISKNNLGNIINSSLAQLSWQLRQDNQTLPDTDIHQFLDFLQNKLEKGQYNTGGYLTGFSAKIAEVCVEGRGIMINNWSKFPAYAMDFSDTPLWFDLATVIPMHFAMMMPAKDGVVLRLFLPDGWLAETITLLRESLQPVG